MKKFTSVIVLVFIVVVNARPQNRYTTKYDDLHIDNIITNNRTLRSYVNCFLDKQKCTPDGAELKSILPDALLTECSNCSDAQKSGTRRMLNFLIEEKPEFWDQLEAKYDSQGVYRKQYEAEANEQGKSL